MACSFHSMRLRVCTLGGHGLDVLNELASPFDPPLKTHYGAILSMDVVQDHIAFICISVQGCLISLSALWLGRTLTEDVQLECPFVNLRHGGVRLILQGVNEVGSPLDAPFPAVADTI